MIPGPGCGRQQRLELAADAVAGADVIADVGPVEAGDDQPVVGDAELASRCRRGCAGRRSRSAPAAALRDAASSSGREQAIIGAEVVPPFADAMGFVDRDQREVGIRSIRRRKLSRRRAFGRDVEQVELARRATASTDRSRILARRRSARRRGCRSRRRFGSGRASARSAARSPARCRRAPAPAAGSTATCPPRSASPPACAVPPSDAVDHARAGPRGNASKPKTVVERSCVRGRAMQCFGAMRRFATCAIRRARSAPRSAAWRCHSSA